MDADTPRGLRARFRRRPVPERTSEVLRHLTEQGAGDELRFRDILAQLRHRALGFALLIFSLLGCVPIPGLPTVCGVALVVIALNLITVRRRLWLPRAIADKSVNRADLARIVERVSPYLERLEKICKPRFPIVTDTVGKILIGLVIFALGFIMILPIPFIGNTPPGFAASLIAIGMTERDGLIVLIGTIASAVAIAIASVATEALVSAVIQYFSS